jgi:hypothetical protein
LTAPTPASTTAAPTSPPTRAWLELDGRPHHQVARFQATAAVSAAPTTVTVRDAGTWTIVAIVSATAAPSTSGPSRLQTAARTIAGPGRAPLVATSVAIALAASWKPLVTANARVSTTASTNAVSTGRQLLPAGADHSPGSA